jgi:hypothetical protein
MIGGTPGFANSVFYDNLVLDTSPSSGNVDDNTPATAQNIGVLSSTFTRQDVVGTTDSVDWYKFTLNQISELNYSITGSPSTVSVSIFFDSNQNGILDNSEATYLSEVTRLGNDLLKALIPGNYYVRVTTATNVNAKYNLRLSTIPVPSNLSSDPGSDPVNAFDITPLFSSGSFTAKDAVGAYDQYDYYKFTITQPRNFTSTAINSPYFTQVGIGLQGNRDGTYSPGTSSYYIANLGPGYPPRRLLPGTYYVRVQTAVNVHTRYELTFNLS